MSEKSPTETLKCMHLRSEPSGRLPQSTMPAQKERQGLLFALKHHVPALTRRGGAIVNVSSIVGSVGMPGVWVYAASKRLIGQPQDIAQASSTERRGEVRDRHRARRGRQLPGQCQNDVARKLAASSSRSGGRRVGLPRGPPPARWCHPHALLEYALKSRLGLIADRFRHGGRGRLLCARPGTGGCSRFACRRCGSAGAA